MGAESDDGTAPEADQSQASAPPPLSPPPRSALPSSPAVPRRAVGGASGKGRERCDAAFTVRRNHGPVLLRLILFPPVSFILKKRGTVKGWEILAWFALS